MPPRACASSASTRRPEHSRPVSPRMTRSRQLVTTTHTSFFDTRFLHVIQFGEVALEVRGPFSFGACLHGPGTHGSPFAILAIKFVDGFHPLGHFPKSREAFAVQPRIVGQIDEDL